MKKIITIGLPIVVAVTLLVLLLNQRTAHSDLTNSSDTSMNNMADTAMYHNNPAASTNMTATYPATQYNTARRPVSHHRTYTSRSSYPAQSTTVKKKGWSSAAKGTAIGAGSGAVLGAVIAGDHNRVKGAVVGGVVGAAGGYLYGRHRDKKHKRY